MDTLPDQLLWEVFRRIEDISDRISFSLSCRRFYRLDNEERTSLCVGCGLNPVNEAMACLCNRFFNLSKIKITYSGWTSSLGQQLDDHGLFVLSNNCPSLSDLTLSFCTFITDSGLGYLALCLRLSALRLNFIPRISGWGILSLVVGCKEKLKLLHLCRCMQINSVGWLDYLGKLEALEDLSINNCRGIREIDLLKLGPAWRKIKRLCFEVDTSCRNMKVCDQLDVNRWKRRQIPCESMVEISLRHCIASAHRGLACILGSCENLETIKFDTCIGLRDCDFWCLARTSRNLKSISLQISLDFALTVLRENELSLTDEFLKALAQNCSTLESFVLCFAHCKFRYLPSFSADGITDLAKASPLKELVLEGVYFFDDLAMEALCSARCLEVLKISRCQEISDEGLEFVGEYPKLRVLRFSKCVGITNNGFISLVGSYKFEALAVEDCPEVTEMGIAGVARSVSYRQDLSWLS